MMATEPPKHAQSPNFGNVFRKKRGIWGAFLKEMGIWGAFLKEMGGLEASSSGERIVQYHKRSIGNANVIYNVKNKGYVMYNVYNILY